MISTGNYTIVNCVILVPRECLKKIMSNISLTWLPASAQWLKSMYQYIESPN